MLISETYIRVRYYETDQMGIVHHSNYIRYFECGRDQLLNDISCPIKEVEKSGVLIAVAGLDAKYHRSAFMGDTLRAVTTVPDRPLARMVVNCKIFNQRDELVCSGSVTLAFIDSEKRRPMRCPQIFLDAFDKYQ